MPTAEPVSTGSTSADPLEGYRPLPGVADELMDVDSRVRPVWEPFIAHFGALRPDEIGRRFARGDEYLRDAGVFFRQYGEKGSSERDWPLSHVPVLLRESEWQEIAAGLTQRAELLEAVVADLYGANRLVAEGHLPAALVAQNPEWLRPLVGVTPAGGHFLHFLSFELGRGPDGRWWVLGDRTQAPSGAGFALENRVATARVFSDLYAEAHVHRLAGFFRAFRDALHELRGTDGGRAAILTPGPHNDTYFEHAYIARYLGMMLLEGEDLAVERGRLMVRTVSGQHPVGVLWRRLDASWADPLELDETSTLGVAGLVDAVRQGHVSVVNALGAGVLEARALLAFMPRICVALRGEPLAIPNVATWWCGQPAERDHVAANAGRMTISPALSTRLPFGAGGEPAGGWPRGGADDPIRERLMRDGPLLVGQEAVTLSTAPAYVEGRLRPRPMSLRVFLARTGTGWQVMPGGFARIGRGGDASALAMQQGGSVADVWVVSERPVETVTMLPARTAPYVRPAPGPLPSRAADNLYWLGRYIERAEGAMRLARAYHFRLAEAADPQTPLLRHLSGHLDALGIDPGQRVPEAIHEALASAIVSAGKVRDRFSLDGWMALNDLARTARRMTGTVTPGEDEARAMGVLLRKISGFSGLVHENMYRFTGWRFLTIGRSLERALHMASVLASFADPAAPEGALDLAVDVGDSAMSHRRRYAVATTRETVVDLLALDAMNPRSILYHLTELRDQIALLPGAEVNGRKSAPCRAVLQLHAGLSVRTPEELDGAMLTELASGVCGLSDVLAATYLS